MAEQAVATPPVEVLVSASGFDISYPIARTQKGDLLRPLKQPQYDTESMPASATTQILFFAKPQGQADASGGIASKTISETNLTQAGQITVPNQFKLYGFQFEVQSIVTVADYRLIYSTAAWQFIFGGTRVYLQCPLSRIPQGMGPEGFAALDGNSSTTSAVMVHNGLGMVSNYYNFAYNKATMHIQSAENFQAKNTWSASGGVTLSQATRTTAYLIGITFSGM
jgi:hypothetical protein